MSVHASAWAWEQEVYTTAKLVLVALADFADHEGRAWPGVDLLSSKSGVPPRTVKRALATLRDAGLITVEQRRDDRGHRRSDLYRLQMTPAVYPAAPADETAETLGATLAPRPTGPPGHRAMGHGATARVQDENRQTEPSKTPPSPPRGERTRDRETYLDELAAWASHHFPGVAVQYVAAAIAHHPPDRPLDADGLRWRLGQWTDLDEVDRRRAEIAASTPPASDPDRRMTGVGHPRPEETAA